MASHGSLLDGVATGSIRKGKNIGMRTSGPKFLGMVFPIFFVITIKVMPLQALASPMQDLLRNRIESAGIPLALTVSDELIYASVVLPVFYERRTYVPAWVDEKGVLPQAISLVHAIQKADEQGLQPSDYHLTVIEPLLAQIGPGRKSVRPQNLRMLVDLDLLLTDAFLIYGSHLVAGRINPERIDPQWFVSRREGDVMQVLEEALESAEIEKALKSLVPRHAGYDRLLKALAFYRQVAAEGGWPAVPQGSKQQKGDQSDQIPILRQRLAAEKYLEDPTSAAGALFDDQLEQALKRFQIHNGLEPDGVLGPQTIKALNVTAEDRIRQIFVNMERWRWLPQDLGSRYLLVNIAGFYLYVIENQQPVMDMRVVTGKPYRRTPVFSDKITYLVMHPYWSVPRSIAAKDILPQIKKDPAFAGKQHFKIFRGQGADTMEVDPDTIDWQTVTAANLNFRFRQEPGPLNALGRVKFMFPNKFDVYLHDTPARTLFARARRDFSSGCIRIEKPLDLAEYLLRNHPDWPPENVRQALGNDKGTEKTIQLPEPVNIHILYWTAWVGNDDLIHFRPDIYNRDKAVAEALQTPPPGA